MHERQLLPNTGLNSTFKLPRGILGTFQVSQAAVAVSLPSFLGGFLLLELFRPQEYLSSVYELDVAALWGKGLRGLLVDLDNTLLPRDSNATSAKLKQWLEEIISTGFKVCIVSNNWSNRVEGVAEELGVPMVARAAKPRRQAFHQGMQYMGTQADETAVIGDQMFTDILGGNRTGLYTILVKPLTNQELLQTRLLRRLERRILRRLARNSERAKKDGD